MKTTLLPLFIFFCCHIATETFATTYYWDHSQSAHWARAKNWNSGGAGGFPDATSAEAWLVYNNYPNSGGQGVGSSKMNVTVDDNDSNADTFKMKDLLVGTDASNHDWTFNDGSTAGKLIVYDNFIFDLRNGGSATFNVELELGDNTVDLYGAGNRAVLNGKLIGGTSAVLDGTKSYYPAGETSFYGGGLKLTSANNDDFLGTIKTGRQKVEITQANGLRNATIEISNVANSFIYPNDALIGALGGNYSLRLDNNLKVGNNNKDTTYAGSFSQGGLLTKEGTATWTLSGASTHTGRTTINGGKIKLANVNALQNSEVWLNVNDGLDLNGYNANIAGLGGGGNLALGSATLTIGGSGDYLNLGTISGTGGITINMTGSQDFGSGNTYSGGTILSGGTLKCGSQATLGAASGDLTIGNATLLIDGSYTETRALKFAFDETLATIDVDSGKTLTWSGLINDPSDAQSLRKMGAGTLVINNHANIYSANILIEEGVVAPFDTSLTDARIVINTNNGLQISGNPVEVGSINGSGALKLEENLTIGNHPSTGNYSGALSQSGAKTLTKIGPSTQTFSGTSTRNGPTIINAGTINIQNLTETPLGAGTVTVNTNGTLTGNGVVGSPVVVNPGGTITTSSSSADLSMTGLTLAGTFDCSVSGSSASLLVVGNNLDLTGSTLKLQGTPTQTFYLLMTYGTLSGKFSTVQNLPAGYKIDYAYSGNFIALVEDNTAPTVTSITPITASPTSSTNVSFTVVFDEAVAGFGSFADLSIGETASATATGANFSTSDNTTFTVTLTGVSGDGALTLAVVTGGNVKDEAGNNLASSPTSSAVTIDNMIPTVSITTAEGLPSSANSISYSVSFSEPVTGLVDSSDLYITGTTQATTDIGATSIIDLGGGTNFTLTLNNLSGDGFLQFRLRANQIADAAGNNLATDPVSPVLLIDNTAPVLTLNGAVTLTLGLGSAWIDPGATADDGSSVVIGGDIVNTSVPTVYTPTYDATDMAGNIATQLTRTVIVLDAYTTWAEANGLTNGVSDGPDDNPDGDRWNNRAEYALDGDPLNTATPDTQVWGGLADVNGTNYLTHTFPVLDGTSFTGTPTMAGTQTIVAYRVAGSTNLFGFFETVLEVTPALTNSLPPLDSGWEYRTFRLQTETGAEPQAFIKLQVETSAP